MFLLCVSLAPNKSSSLETTERFLGFFEKQEEHQNTTSVFLKPHLERTILGVLQVNKSQTKKQKSDSSFGVLLCFRNEQHLVLLKQRAEEPLCCSETHRVLLKPQKEASSGALVSEANTRAVLGARSEHQSGSSANTTSKEV